MNNISKYVKENKNSLLNSMIFLLFGIVLCTNPGNVLEFVSYITGGILIVIGTINIINYNRTLKKLNIDDRQKLISGITIIFIGFAVMLFSSLIETTIRLICGGWIIYTGVVRLVEAISIRDNKSIYLASLIISILMILCGFYVAVTTNLVFSIIGLFIMIYAILDIIEYIVYKKKDA